MSQFDINLAVQQYTNNVQLLLQQRGSKLRDKVIFGSHVGKQAAVVDQYAPVNARRRTGRNEPLTGMDTQNDRRWVLPNDYDWDERVDNFDKLRLIVDPMSSYVQNGVYAMGRAMDAEIITAFFGTAKTGETGSTSTTFPSTQQVAVDVGAAAATGLNVAKLRAAKKILLANEVDIENDPLYIAITAEQHDDLLGDPNINSKDYNDRPVLVDGKVTSFMGFNFVHIEGLSTDTSSYRRIPVWAKSGMHLGMWNDITTDISQRKDLSSLPWQVYVYGTFGATRTEEKKIVEIKCSE